MCELFGVATTEIDKEFRAGGKGVPLSNQMIDGAKMRSLIAKMLELFRSAMLSGNVRKYPVIAQQFEKNPGRAIGFVLGAISDLCFNLEYVRRITDARWSYCTQAGDHRVYYPYLGVCPHCVLTLARPVLAALGVAIDASEAEKESRARYFGNKIESHHVGRIGERILVYILDLLTKSKHADAITILVFDDQHDVDAAFFFEKLGVLTQIKASPLILLPVVSFLAAPLTNGVNEQTGLPQQRKDHSFTDFASSEHDLHLYFSIDNSTIPLGRRTEEHWPYEPFVSALTEDDALKIIQNWISIYLSFEIPKRERREVDVKRAYLTSGWGAPIDDNKTKAGLARSDNMMKGTYASLKYGAYYVQECKRRSLKTALVANIDPAHQYAEYLEKLHDIRWGHSGDFLPDEKSNVFRIAADRLTNLFDCVFTLNRQIMNDRVLADAWGFEAFFERLMTPEGEKFLAQWREVPNAN
jgi:hypothetical protein